MHIAESPSIPYAKLRSLTSDYRIQQERDLSLSPDVAFPCQGTSIMYLPVKIIIF